MDFSNPTLTTGYADFVAAVKARDEDIAKMFDGTTTTNLPTGAKRWNATAKKFEKFDGTSWGDLTTLYEIKVADSNKLNGQLSTYYATANHNHNLVYAALSHTHDYSPSTHNHDSTYLGKTATAADSSKVGGKLPSTSAFGDTVATRDANGDLTARYFKGALSGNATTATTAGSCTGNAATATTAANASKLINKTFTYSGKTGTPTYTWGTTDGTNFYAYNPANFSVNYANSAGTISGGIGSLSAAIGLGAVGSYAMLSFPISSGTVAEQGTSYAGSSLRYSGARITSYPYELATSVNTIGPTGTWKAMGYGTVTLFLRIA
jgi:hypothetical protein